MFFYNYRIYHLISNKTKSSTTNKERLLGHFEDYHEACQQFNTIMRDFMRTKRHKIGDMLVLKYINKIISSVKIDITINSNRGCTIDENKNAIVIKNERKLI
jgi:hypothetical protein